MGGHVFVVNGDLTKIACDAVLIPVDETWWVETAAFGSLLGILDRGVVPGHPDEWPDNGMWLAVHGDTDGSKAFRDPDVWVGDIGRQDMPDSSHFAQRATAFVAAASRQVRETIQARAAASKSDQPPRRPLLCLNVLGSGAGGKRTQRGQLLEALIPALDEAALSADCDVILVCFGETMYAAAQSIRRRHAIGKPAHSGWAQLGDELKEHADRLASIARDGHLVLFMGAGVSADVGVPAWMPLLASLAQDLLGFDEKRLELLSKLDPRDQAHLIETLTGPHAFKAALDAKMTMTRHGLAHALLASLPCAEVVTTNFDELFEHASDAPGRRLAVIPGGEVKPGERWLLKLHGTLGGDVVFTRSDYFSATSSHAALRGIVQAMLLTRHMLFVGYSLADEDFNQLVHEVRQARGDTALSLGTALFPEGNPLLPTIWPDLTIVSPDESNLEFSERVRRLWIMLDWVGMQASSPMSYLADESFGEMHSEDEMEISELVGRLVEFRSRAGSSSSAAWTELDQFLSRFGRHS